MEYVLIGGIAAQTHGHVRMANDADLIPAPDPGNLECLAAALNSLDAQDLGDLTVPVAGLDDLIRMKPARGRPIHLEDIKALTDPG